MAQRSAPGAGREAAPVREDGGERAAHVEGIEADDGFAVGRSGSGVEGPAMSTGARPPRSARALIERALPAELRDTVCADLDEMFQRRAARDGLGRARIWYTKQALAFAARFAWERVRGRERRRDSERAFQSNDSRIRVSLLDWKLGFRMLVKY